MQGGKILKFKKRYRIESSRLRSWDYASPGWYFVTICTKQMKPFFGRIDQGCPVYNDLGQIANQYLSEIPWHHTNAAIDEFIVMPNHIHGIIVLVETLQATSLRATSKHASPQHATSKHTTLPSGSTMSSISPRKGSLGVIVRSYKSAVTHWARKNGNPDFAWQPRFYDHIIRNDASLSRIRTYIQFNPMKWEKDKFFG